MDPLHLIFQYHERTKHQYQRYAASLGYLDWDSQPDPFRVYRGAPRLALPIPSEAGGPLYDDLFTPAAIAPQPLTVASISSFFYFSMALSAWKRFGETRWSLRVNPSSGNLHPTEAYALLPPIEGLSTSPGAYHYAPPDHALEPRRMVSGELWHRLMSGAAPDAFLLGLSSIVWREAWKYGERAYRYVHLDVGHALGALRLAAALQGWSLRVFYLPEDTLARLIGLHRFENFSDEEPETPDVMAVVDPMGSDPAALPSCPDTAVTAWADGEWLGKPNLLSPHHHQWEWIGKIQSACRSVSREEATLPQPPQPPVVAPPPRPLPAAGLIRRRRSAQAMDGRATLPRDAFLRLLRHAHPTANPILRDLQPGPPRIHVALFIHAVEALDPGLYVWVRRPDAIEALRSRLRSDAEWKRPEGWPEDLDFFRIQPGNFRALAASLSCAQSIAGDGCFSASLISEFEVPLRDHGPSIYPRLYWEAGWLGQILYLEAEAAGLSGTGIGCFFDSATHELLGLRDPSYQILYHFTVGRAIEDSRLATDPAYPPR